MDALKSAGRALIRSPSISRHSWGLARHHKLSENWTDTKETLQEGMAFHLKYLGVTAVDQPKGEGMAAAAIRRIITVAKARGKKFLKVTLTVSPRGIMLEDTTTNELIENISIYRISYCTADKTQDKVFAYIARSHVNETLECHAFLCPKKKIAQAVTLTVAQAFRIAYDLWEVAQEEKCKKTRESCNSPETASLNGATRCVEPGKECNYSKRLHSKPSPESIYFTSRNSSRYHKAKQSILRIPFTRTLLGRGRWS
ncbi:low density lipoprotein receptor adapter protein 1-B isoform X3 [Leucoraja erinacea]|uniref:low density lipoprotein receptor adapter protein 1-B isoform X3 n=1 Tax=Leucoraja erinaceus TaxID=7782 RepID=UPI0024571246|nr:low density lipoprotein receptor adapter protein 1-B isoform X3 [Leucoraja erinacea]XP_055491519.1 low density lipoprotein receptor adapter protein 1-B isoform X3 [Leucoraja erinacea]